MYKPILVEAQNFFLLIPDSNKGFTAAAAIDPPSRSRAIAAPLAPRRPTGAGARPLCSLEKPPMRKKDFFAIIKCARIGTVGCERRRAKSSVGLTSAVLKPSANSVAAFSRVLSLEAIWIDADFCGHSRGSPS